MREHRLRSSSIRCFKNCPMKFYYEYIKGIKPMEEQEVLRIGTNWHTLMEIIGLTPGTNCPSCADDYAAAVGEGVEYCPLCNNTAKVPEDKLGSITRYMNNLYHTIPATKTETEWVTEKIRLLYSAMAYIVVQKTKDVPYPVLDNEILFDFPLRNESGRKVRGMTVGGQIDKLLHDAGPKRIIILDHKSTSHNINDELFWSRFNMDVQTKMYPYALLEMDRQGLFRLEGHSLAVMVDAYHKPQSTPSKLTQAETKEFSATGTYCGQKFEIEYSKDAYRVNSTVAEVFPGAKEGTMAIRETPEMYGARLLQEILAEPTKYFACRELGKTTEEMNAFGQELIGMATSIRAFEKHNLWYRNEDHCEARYKCDYIPICYGGIDVDREENIIGFTRQGK